MHNPFFSGIDDIKAVNEEAGYQYLGIYWEVNEEAEKIVRGKDLHDKFVRFIVKFDVSIPLMVGIWVPLPLSMQQLGYMMLVIAAPVFAFVAYTIFRAAWILSHPARSSLT